MDATRTKTGARVLLVEDDQNIRELVELHLQLEGLTVVSKSDGNEALAQRPRPTASTSSCST